MEKNHDLAVEREGVFKRSHRRHPAAKAGGFKVFSNTTVYKETDMNEIWELFEYLEQFKLDGHSISPAYGYSAVNDREIFMTREDIHEKFKDIDKLSKRFPLVSSPDLHGIPEGRPRPAVHGLGHAHLQRQGLEGPVLSDHGRALRDVRRSDDQDAMGQLRRRATIRAATTAWCIADTSLLRLTGSIQNSAIRSNR